MEKKIYEKPAMQVEAFIANDYCVNCSTDPDHQMVTYNFVCTAGAISSGTPAYAIHNASEQIQTIAGKYMDGGRTSYYFHPCNATHQFSVKRGTDLSKLDNILTGLHIDRYGTVNRWGEIEDVNRYRGCDPIPVTVWVDDRNSIHCTTALNPEEWSTEKS